MSYQSPIKIIFGEMQTKLEIDVLKAIQNYGITVDKNELLKALNYDRDQYNKGYKDGYEQSYADIIRCKDCRYWDNHDGGERCLHAIAHLSWAEPDNFCSYGIKVDEHENNE